MNWTITDLRRCAGVMFFGLICASGLRCASPLTPNIRGTQLAPTERSILEAHGDRLTKPGKEVLTLTGTLDQYSGGQAISTHEVTLVWTYPGLFRVDNATTRETISFDGLQVTKLGGASSQLDTDLVESFVMDSTENFFLSRYSGSTATLIGHNYNVKDSRAGLKLSGQCDLFHVSEANGVRGAGSKVEKMFCFDPANGLLKVVVYRDGSGLVETRYSGWRTVDGNAVPGVIQRYRNNSLVMKVTLAGAAFTAH